MNNGTMIEKPLNKSSDTVKRLLKYIIFNRDLYYILLIGLIPFITFRLLPFYGVQIAFQDYNIFKGFTDVQWVGFKWFKILFKNPDFFKILRNSLSINLLELIFVFPSSIILALLLNELRNEKFKKLVQSVAYLPHFLSWVIIGGFIIQMLSPTSGPIRLVFEALGMKPTMLLLQEKYFYTIIITGEIWKAMGWGTILYLAALAGIDAEQYEAAWVDGANRWQRLWNITLPGIKFIVVLQLILQMGSMINVGFEKMFVLSTPSTMGVADVFSTFNYRVGIGQQRYSFSAALSLFESVINFTLVCLANFIAKKAGEEGLF